MATSEYEMITAARLFVLERAIGALIVTHSDAGAFAQAFSAASGLVQIEHMTAPGATPAVRQAATQMARDLIGLADDEVARRRRRTTDED
mgnify:CR=1 FL=1